MAYNTRGTSRNVSFDSFNDDPIILDAGIYDSRYQNIKHDGSTNNTIPLALGTRGKTRDGREFKYVRFADGTNTASEGSTLSAAPPLTPTFLALASDGLSITVTDTTINTAGSSLRQVEPDLIGSVVVFTSSSGEIKQTLRRIVDNTRNITAASSYTLTLYLDRPLVVGTDMPGGTPTLSIYQPNAVLFSTTVETPVVGVSIGALTVRDTTTSPYTEYCGWIQTKGICVVNVANSETEGTTQGAANKPSGILVPSATDGMADVYGVTTPTAAEAIIIASQGFGKVLRKSDTVLNIVDRIDTGSSGRQVSFIDCTRFNM